MDFKNYSLNMEKIKIEHHWFIIALKMLIFV